MELGSGYLYVAAGAPHGNHAGPLHKIKMCDGGALSPSAVSHLKVVRDITSCLFRSSRNVSLVISGVLLNRIGI